MTDVGTFIDTGDMPEDTVWFARVWDPSGQQLWIASGEQSPRGLMAQARAAAASGYEIDDVCTTVTGEDSTADFWFDWRHA